MSEIWQRLMRHFDPAAIAKWLATALPRMVTALVIVIFFWLLSKALLRGFEAIKRRTKLDETLSSFFRTAIRYVIFIIALLTALSELGVNTGSLLTSLGILGLTIGFAARDTLSNVISGLFIFWDRPFVVGDLIDIGGHYGRVHDITLRSTRVVTIDGKMLAIPNTSVVNSTVASYTNFPNLRLELRVTIGVNEDIDKVRGIFLALVKGDERYLADPAPDVVLVSVNDFNLTMEFRVWLVDEKQHIAERFELRERLFEALRSAGVDLPYQTIQLQPVELHTRASSAA
ncbi:MAG: mechanosensitive ion channel family protein [Myxococcales bacterium]|nr:mechanosensitive ion channel family protein [Myxococcales bacterium]